LAEAVEKLGPVEHVRICALTDITALLATAQRGAEEHGVPLGEGGLHAAIAENGVIGDPSRASIENGQRYWDTALAAALAAIDE
jgi:creatinine amidohydrolase/Fe(II)-dependent formamide hydrolase-like protein